MKQTNTLVIGASAAGLACAACLQKQGIEYLVVEKEAQVGTPWRNRYERLHLHTSKGLSNLPYRKFGSSIQRYPSREEVVSYLEEYCKAFNITPVFNAAVQSIVRDSGQWVAETGAGAFRARHLVLATGVYGRPKTIRFTGMEQFPGKILHSSLYKSGKAFEGQKVLVVGFGNSACEIAIDLYEQGARPAMAVRSAVNVIPRELLGIPIVRIGLLLSHLPAPLADALTTPVPYLFFGNLGKLGLKEKSYGTFRQIQKDGKIPLIDIGTIAHIRQGHINIFPGIDHIEGNVVHFENGRAEAFDAIVAAIGYENTLRELLPVAQDRIDDMCLRAGRQKWFGKDGLYGCGFWVGPSGQLREIALDAQKIAKDILRAQKLMAEPL